MNRAHQNILVALIAGTIVALGLALFFALGVVFWTIFLKVAFWLFSFPLTWVQAIGGGFLMRLVIFVVR